ncbi:MAG: D-alanine--D-alanine ligase family protein, partial [Halothiobacillaceae bacterium]
MPSPTTSSILKFCNRTPPLDAIAEYDSPETIETLKKALESGGHEVLLLEADESIAEKLRHARPDLVFNIAEGLRGLYRESHVPAICEMLGIPYTGSDPLTLALCLDKARAKQILIYHGLVTPRAQIFWDVHDPLSPDLHFPLIVKLLREGSSMGLTPDSVADDEEAMRRQVARLLTTYHEPVLVEEFIVGREFTVPIVGNRPPRLLPIIETLFSSPRGIVFFQPDEAVLKRFPELRSKVASAATHQSVCPAELSPDLKAAIEETALRAYRALGCLDWCRMEMRLGPDGR